MKRIIWAAPFVAVAMLAPPADAVVTATWTVETYQQFDAGDASDAFITSGRRGPAWLGHQAGRPRRRTAAWSALWLADGTVVIGSDVGGTIYRVTADGAKKVVSIDGAIAVVALAQTADGTVYAGAMPGNKVWKLDLAAGKATPGPVLKDAETVWSLAASGNTVYAGTGPNGRLYAVTGGAAKQVFDSEDKRITALTVTSDGAVWLGTSERALVFRFDPKTNEARAMADFAGNEVTALAPFRDGVVAAANDLVDQPAPAGKTAAQVEAAEKPTAQKGQTTKAPDVGSKPGADRDPSPVTDLGRKGAKKGKGALFRIAGDGRLDQLHALTQTYFTSVAVGPDGAVFAGAADKGRIYMVDPDEAVATAFDVDERAVSQVWFDHGLIGFTTDDAAAVYRATGRASKARYVSDVLDAKAVSKFGKLTWTSSGKVAVEISAGNTAKLGVGWSKWHFRSRSARSARPRRRQRSPARPTLPAGKPGSRAEDDAARVRRVMAYYVPQNTATLVSDVGVEIASKESTPTLKDSGRQAAQA